MTSSAPATAPLLAKAKETWSLGNFDLVASIATTRTAAELVRFAGIRPGERVLDVGTGSGVAALTARRLGAKVTGQDLTPSLLEVAGRHAALAGFDDVRWAEGDAARMDFPDGSFDVVVSQFGHMFAPDPTATASEMLRVLKPGGRIAFSTWPAEHYVGRMFAMNARFVPPPAGVPSPILWGEPAVVRERLGNRVKDLVFRRGTMEPAALSPQHFRQFFEQSFGPTIRILEALRGDAKRLAAWRAEWDALITEHFQDNFVLHEYLMTRATKA